MNTYTFAIMHVSKETYEEIKRKMLEANCHHVFHSHYGGPVIDMNGIAIQAKEEPVVMTTERIEDDTAPKDESLREAWEAWQEDQKTNPNAVNPHAFVYGYKIGKAKAEAEREVNDKGDQIFIDGGFDPNSYEERIRRSKKK